MSIQFDIAKQIIAETCPNRKLKLENIRLFADIIQPKKYQKGDIILNEGDICNCLFYIEKGFIRQHYLKHDKDVIEHLACEKDVVWCIDSYFNREPTHLMMDAVENSVLWEIPRDIMEELSDANGDIAYLYRSFFENSLMLSQLKADILRFESANDRYARLQQHFPEITRRAPLTGYVRINVACLKDVDNLTFYVSDGKGTFGVPLSDQQRGAFREVMNLYSKDRILNNQIRDAFIDKWKSYPNLNALKVWFEKISLSFKPTSVGKILAHANAQRCDKTLPSL